MSSPPSSASGTTILGPSTSSCLTDSSSSTSTFDALKKRIQAHYDVCSSYYLSLWGQHIHHGYWAQGTAPEGVNSLSETETETGTPKSKEEAQEELIRLLIRKAGLQTSTLDSTQAATVTNTNSNRLKVLDVGCGVGGTSRYLARELGYQVVGITISEEQVKIAYELSREEQVKDEKKDDVGKGEGQKEGEKIKIGERGGSVRFIRLDAEKMGQYFGNTATKDTPPAGRGQTQAGERERFDIVWISEALSHFPDKALFFANASSLLASTTSTSTSPGLLVLADWFKAPSLSAESFDQYIRPIEDGMLLPPLDTMDDYVRMAEEAGLSIKEPGGEVMDISQEVAKTWYVHLSSATFFC